MLEQSEVQSRDIRSSELELGTWAEWISGLGTAGSLLLGFSILRNDRRKEDQAEATQVVTWFVNRTDGNVELNVTNGGSRPIVHVMFVLASVGDNGRRDVVRMLDLPAVLHPGETATLEVPFKEFHANALYPSYVSFRDANGAHWRRNVRSGRLRHQPVPLRFSLDPWIGVGVDLR